MQLAVNYSPQSADLLKSGAVTFDLFKCPDWPDLVATARAQHPVYVHFPLMAGTGQLGAVDWDAVEAALESTGTKYVNLHLAPNASDFPGMPIDTQDAAWTAVLIERMMDDIDGVKSHFRADQIILENVPWGPDPKFRIPRPALEPAVVSQIVTESGCGLLFDTAHARIAALYLGVDSIEYVAALPLEHLRELHITGTIFDAQKDCWSDHFPMQADDWLLAEWVFARIASGDCPAPEIVALEYGGVGPMFEWRSQSDVLAVDIPRLHALVQSTQTSVIER